MNNFIDTKHNMSTFTAFREDVIVDDLSYYNMNFANRKFYINLEKQEKYIVKWIDKNIVELPEGGLSFTTTGSSEAIFLALSFYLHQFRDKNPKRNKANFLISPYHHMIFQKFALLHNVEMRLAPIDMQGNIVSIKEYEKLIDKNTFVLVGVAGTTELGNIEDIEQINNIASKYNLPVHVDAAIGGFILPFSQTSVDWNFKLSQVKSINVSLHKYGLSLPGLGCLSLKDSSVIPSQWRKKLQYMSGGSVTDLTLTCSRNAYVIADAYYKMKALDLIGYGMQLECYNRMKEYLIKQLSDISDAVLLMNDFVIPVVLVKFLNAPKNFAQQMNRKGWGISYQKLLNLDGKYMRIVIRNNFTTELIDDFVTTIKEILYTKEEANDNIFSFSGPNVYSEIRLPMQN